MNCRDPSQCIYCSSINTTPFDVTYEPDTMEGDIHFHCAKCGGRYRLVFKALYVLGTAKPSGPYEKIPLVAEPLVYRHICLEK